jgi:hypothetical protein
LASNRPIQGIDLDGLEFFPLNPKTPGGMTMKAIAITADKVAKNWNDSRVGKFTNGLVNTGFGVAATISSVEYIGATGGAGAALGGGTALMLSLGEIGIGVAQMTDAIAGNNNKTDLLHNSSTLPGLIAYGTGFRYATYIDAFSALGATYATSGGIKALMKDGIGLKSAFGAFTESPKILNILGAIDQVLDVKGFAVESVNLFNNFGTGSDSKILKFQTLQYQLSHTTQSGDNLTSIALRLNTTVEVLVKQNNISNPDDIKIGQKISYTNTVTVKAPYAR